MIKDSANVWPSVHYTSRICNELFRKYAKHTDSVLDVGTGTGVLAVKAREWTTGNIVAVDVQEEAVKCAEENCTGLEIDVKQSYLNWGVKGTFDVVIANLYATPAAEFLQYAKASMNENAILILTLPEVFPEHDIEQWFRIIDKSDPAPYIIYVLK